MRSLGTLAVWRFPPGAQRSGPATRLEEPWASRSEHHCKGLADSPRWAYSRTCTWRSPPGGFRLQSASPFQPFESSQGQPQTWNRDNHSRDIIFTPIHRKSKCNDMIDMLCAQVRGGLFRCCRETGHIMVIYFRIFRWPLFQILSDFNPHDPQTVRYGAKVFFW